jgi:predicted metal-dependent hydrolase
MAPPAALDYIVVHELAHLAEPYHSLKFWLIVRSHYPRFEEYRASLKNYEDRMRLPE